MIIEDPKTASFAKLEADLKNSVYVASAVFERLEDAHRVRGSGHDMAGEVADFAAKLLRERWIA